VALFRDRKNFWWNFRRKFRKNLDWIRRKNVLNGTRDLSDLRVLCERHNFEYALQREDTTGGSDPKDWEE